MFTKRTLKYRWNKLNSLYFRDKYGDLPEIKNIDTTMNSSNLKRQFELDVRHAEVLLYPNARNTWEIKGWSLHNFCGVRTMRLKSMRDAAVWFRARLSERLRAALTEGDRAAIRTLRCIMAAIDNASAVSQEEGAGFSASSTNEVPRRCLSEREIAEILQAEIDARSMAADEYERLGNPDQIAQLRDEIATIGHLTTLLNQVDFS